MINNKKRIKKRDYILVLAVLVALVGILISINIKTVVKDDLYDIKVKAATIMAEATKEIKAEKARLNILPNKEIDINQTGIIGEHFTGITTTIGSIEAKRTASTPDTAAVVVEMLKEAGVNKGDTVAANFSASFPGFNIAVMSACSAMDINIVPIASIGASTFGANQPEFTYIDIHNHLYNKGIFKNQLVAYSIGGDYDIGKNMDEDILAKVLKRIEGYNIPQIYERDFDKNIAIRMGIYKTHGNYKAFINAGGNMAATGEDFFKEGVTLAGKAVTTKRHGLAEKFLIENTSVINLLNVKNICGNYNLPFDPQPISQIGSSAVYYKTAYNSMVLYLTLALVVLLLFWYKKTP